MKLNSLIKYNSLKVLSLIGLLFITSVLYFHFIEWPFAIEVDKIAICHFDANFPLCESHKVEFMEIFTYGIIILISFITFICFGIEFLYRKYKLKDNDIKSYPVFWTIIFWIGIILALIPFLFILWLLIFYKP